MSKKGNAVYIKKYLQNQIFYDNDRTYFLTKITHEFGFSVN